MAKLTAEEEAELSARIAAGDLQARARLIEQNLDLVDIIAKKFTSSGVVLEDLWSEGALAMLPASTNYRTIHGSFRTYAAYWIYHAMLALVKRERRHPMQRLRHDPAAPEADVGVGVEDLRAELNKLEPADLAFIRARYGLDGEKVHCQREMASMMGLLSQRPVIERERAILDKLRRRLQ